jgi:hypothetical protein
MRDRLSSCAVDSECLLCRQRRGDIEPMVTCCRAWEQRWMPNPKEVFRTAREICLRDPRIIVDLA